MMKLEQRILVVGQVPPPYGGQAITIQSLLDAPPSALKMLHVQMKFSREMNEIGRFRLRKLTELIAVIFGIYRTRISQRPKILYYPPAGPSLLPIIRDIAILLSTRWMFKRTAFHFLASGLTEYLSGLPYVVRWIGRIAYGSPDLAILLGPSAPKEGTRLNAHREVIIPCGVADLAKEAMCHPREPGAPIRVLFIGMLSEDKGVLILVHSALSLLNRGVPLHVTCVGRWATPELKAEVERLLDGSPWKNRFEFPGVLIGDDKAARLKASHIFCFPSYFHSETSPLVLMEAMSFSLPIVSTHWRAIPDTVEEDANAILIPPRDIDACAEALGRLINSEETCVRMGARSRSRFLEHFTLSVHQSRMVEALSSLSADNGAGSAS